MSEHIDDRLECYDPTPEETHALESIQTRYPELPHVKPGMMLRFLRSQNLHLQHTAQMIAQHLEWREQMQPESIQVAPGSGLERCEQSGFWRYLHTTPTGVPVVYCAVGHWNPHEYTIEDYEQFGALQAVRTEVLMSKTGTTKHIAIVDLSGWALWHGNYLGYQKRMASLAQSQYPERVASVLMLNAPFLFRTVWSVISQFLGERTTSKVHFVSNAQAYELYDELGVDPSIVERWQEMPVPGWPE